MHFGSEHSTTRSKSSVPLLTQEAVMRSNRMIAAALLAAVALAAVVASLATAESSKEAKAPAQDEIPLPPGWTAEDVQAMMAAATPGKMQERLVKDAGVWQGKNTI